MKYPLQFPEITFSKTVVNGLLSLPSQIHWLHFKISLQSNIWCWHAMFLYDANKVYHLITESPTINFKTEEALSSSVLLWRVLQAFSLTCVHKLKSRGFKFGDCGGPKHLSQKLMLAYIQSCAVFAVCVNALNVGRRNLISWWSSWHMEEIFSANLLCKWQGLTCNPVQTRTEASSSPLILRRQASWGWILGGWHFAVLETSTSRSYGVRLLIKTESTVKVSHRKKRGFGFRDSSGHSTNRRSLQTLLSHCWAQQGFPGTSLTLSSNIFNHSKLSELWDFFPLCQSCHFLAWIVFEVLFDGFLAYNLRSSWSRTIFWELWGL